MISTIRIDQEIARAVNIRYSLTELFLDATIFGMANRIYRSIKDIMTLYALEKALSNAILYNFSETDVENLIYKIREYLGILNYNSKVDYFLARYPSINCNTEIEGPYVEPGDGDGNDVYITEITYINNFYPTTITGDTIINNPTTYIYDKSTSIDNTEWVSQDLTPLITEDGQTTIEGLEFNIGNIDVDTVLLEVQGDDPKYSVSGDGYHIIDTTLYWHHFYDLKVGMQIKIRWRTRTTITT